MRTNAILFCGILALSTLALAGCNEMNADEQQQLVPAELPVAPVLPSYAHLSPTPPPALRIEFPPPITDLQHLAWRPGYWAYDNGEFTWVPGTMIQKPAFTAVWMPDHWEKRSFGWAFVCGYWQ